ncbi:MAG: Transposase IS200 like protein [Bacteroidetes bacterium ADurb.Bin408]|nr:MAG: Transposase IS200 like protein [Bacteroidetes bacterium ADurb.Bin408]
MSEKYKTAEKDKAYFVTFTIVEWLKVLQEDPYKMIILNALKFYQQKRGLLIYAYCIMSNHVHLIVQSNGLESVSEVLRDLKKYTSKEISKKTEADNSAFSKNAMTVFRKEGERLKRIKNYKVWQDGNRPMVLYSNKFIWQKLNYIHNNPVEAGLVLNRNFSMFYVI